MDGAAQGFGQELRRLYAEAGNPGLDILLAQLHDQLPAERRLTTFVVSSWLRDEAAPDSPTELQAFVGLLNDIALRVGGNTYEVQPPQWWESLWYRAVRGEARFSGGPEADPAPPASEHTNAIDGHSRIVGPSIQAREINGDVHVHPPPEAAVPRPRAAQPADDARVVIRVQSGSETIEIYDEGLARYWISARLRMGLGYEQ
ncbi:hypothetical protein [Streptomyces sp. AK02-01A]|uniref:hypothetical protein n=1 Tax=Streptomyces sp. AK02-01A TaxID=3028648 RepID=UPI0029B53778|nr:hypothetical protein [Streptomyces sp. AK02-01A]MDX3855635.1 hypothetical protein [Streptomyces sp. AK02-01A]